MCSPPRCAQGPACSPRLPWRMLEYSTAYSPCPSMATALLYCNCHLALACPHCTATPASLRLTALPLACPHLLRLACIACCVRRTFLRYRSGGALRICSESPLHRPDVVNVVRRHGSACRRRGACGASVHVLGSAQIVRLRKLQSPSLHGRREHCALPPRGTHVAGTAYPLHGTAPRMMPSQCTAAAQARRDKQDCQSPCTSLPPRIMPLFMHGPALHRPGGTKVTNCLASAWHCLLALLGMIA